MKQTNNAADTKGTTLATDTKGTTLATDTKGDEPLTVEYLQSLETDKKLKLITMSTNLVLPTKGSTLDSLKNSVKYQAKETVVLATIEGMGTLPLVVRYFGDDKGNYYLSSKPSNAFGNTNGNTEFNSEYFGTYLESVRETEPTTKRTVSLSDDELINLGSARIEVTTWSNDLVLFIKTKLSTPNSSIPVLKESSKAVGTTLNSLEAVKNSFTHRAINVYKVGLNPLVQTINDQVTSGLLTKELADSILANQSKYIYVMEVPKQTRVRSKA